VWDIPVGYVDGMRAPGRVFASEELLAKAVDDRAVEQVANVATLPGIVGRSLAMPDIHWGYGFPIGGVAATDVAGDGVVSPGGVGFDIGCGVRLLRSELEVGEARDRMRELVDALGRRVPRGVGGKGAMAVRREDVTDVLVEGTSYPVANGMGWDEDVEFAEDGGVLSGAQPGEISERAIERGAPQLGSLGAGNHFLEVQHVDQVRDPEAAGALGLWEGQICVMLHSGSRGLGHQTCTDHLREIDRLMHTTGITVPDRQLACVPFEHRAASSYMGAMNAAGNFARANRQVLTHQAREAFAQVFRRSARDLGLSVVYDVAHNLAKVERHEVDGVTKEVCVHRKGATRALGPHHPDLPSEYRNVGQPVIVPGSMGTPSFVLVGMSSSARAFSSTCHGAGRAMSRTKAKKVMTGEQLRKQLGRDGIHLARSQLKLLSEEAPYAYKDPSEIVAVCEGAGLSKVVARLRPIGVVKG
jgi:tRNA-splicing ligase RtcB